MKRDDGDGDGGNSREDGRRRCRRSSRDRESKGVPDVVDVWSLGMLWLSLLTLPPGQQTEASNVACLLACLRSVSSFPFAIACVPCAWALGPLALPCLRRPRIFCILSCPCSLCCFSVSNSGPIRHGAHFCSCGSTSLLARCAFRVSCFLLRVLDVRDPVVSILSVQAWFD